MSSEERIANRKKRKMYYEARYITPPSIRGKHIGGCARVKSANENMRLMVLREILGHLMASSRARMDIKQLSEITVYPIQTLRHSITLGIEHQVLEVENLEIVLTTAGLRWMKGDLPIAGLVLV